MDLKLNKLYLIITNILIKKLKRMRNTFNKLFKIIFFWVLSFNTIYVNSQISTIIQNAGYSDRLPDGGAAGWEDHWVNAGSPVLTNGSITVKECIDVTEHGVINGWIDYYQAKDNADRLQDIVDIIQEKDDGLYTLIYFPAGAYYFSRTITLNKKFIILKGAGGAENLQGQTHLHFNLVLGEYYQKGCIEVNKKNIGIEDLFIIQDNWTSIESFTIKLNSNAKNCWIKGVESSYTQRFHIGIYGNYNTISGCYFHDAHDYSDAGGNGYGVCLSGKSEHNLIENNIFKHLRHSMVLQAGAKYNVIGYNYSKDPHGFNSGIEYSSCLSDLLFHGREVGDNTFEGPQYNLCEGNYVEKIRMDAEHKANGPNNTFFRNLAEYKYTCSMPFAGIKGFSIATVWGTDDEYRQNVVGCNAKPPSHDRNQIDDIGFQKYWYNNHMESKWQDIPSYQYSYYKIGKPAFWDGYDWINWPYYPDGENPAKSRDFMAHHPPYNATEVVYAGWDLYENMCGPCIFDQGKDITETPALQHNFTATEYITASYAIPDAEPVTFAAGQYIELNPGFETYENGTFEAYIDPTISCDFCNKMLLGDYYPGAQDYSPKQKPEKEKSENKNNTVFECHPNPFNNSTQIIFSIQETTNVRLYITSIYGIEVLELVNNELAKGIHNVNIKGSALASGIYYCILETKDSRRHIKLVKM